MSVRIPRSEISDAEVELIRQMLILHPQKAPTYMQKNFVDLEEKDPIVFYLVKKDSDGIEKVWLPFSFGNILKKKIWNLSRMYESHNFEFKTELRENQVEVVNEALQHLNSYCSTNLFLSTGFGKSRITAFLSTKIKLLTLVVLHLTTLISAWCKEFQENTTAKIWVVETADKFVIPEEFDVIICMNTRIINIPENILDKVGFLIIDEVDRLTTKSRVIPLLSTQPKFVVSLTATSNLRSDGMDSMNQLLTGLHFVKREIAKKMTLYKVNTHINPPTETGPKGVNWSKLMRDLSRNDQRNEMIVKLATQNYHLKTLIVVEFQEHCVLLYQKLKVLGKKVEYMTGTKSSYQDSQILVGSLRKISVGFDDANTAVDFSGIRFQLMILCKPIKDESLLTQTLGRIRNQSPIIMYLIDENSSIKRQWSTCSKYLKERNLGFIDWKTDINKLIVDKEGKIIEKAPEEEKGEIKIKLNITS